MTILQPIPDCTTKLFQGDVIIPSIGHHCHVSIFFGDLTVETIAEGTTIIMGAEAVKSYLHTTDAGEPSLYNYNAKPARLLIKGKVGKNVTIECKTNCNIFICDLVGAGTKISNSRGNIHLFTQTEHEVDIKNHDGDIFCRGVGIANIFTAYRGNIHAEFISDHAQVYAKQGKIYVEPENIAQTATLSATKVRLSSSESQLPEQAMIDTPTQTIASSFLSFFCCFDNEDESQNQKQNLTKTTRKSF